MNPVRIGVVGCGVMGPRHVESTTKITGVQTVAVADLIEERARETAAKFNVPKTYRSGDELIQDPEIDAVVLAFPCRDRPAMALRAFAAGKHVLMEKPVAMNADQVRQMIKARGRLTAGCCSCRPMFYTHAATVAKFIAGGALGDLRMLRAYALCQADKPPTSPRPEWRLKKELNGGGFLMNWGCYDLDYLLGLTGWTLKPRVVLAQTWPVPPQFKSHLPAGSTAEAYYTALVRCDGGAVISLERGEYMPATSEEYWRISGTKGTLRLKMNPAKGKVITFNDSSTADGVFSRTIWEGDESWGDKASGPMADFVAAVQQRRQPQTSLERSLVIQKISDAIYASAEKGDAVKLR